MFRNSLLWMFSYNDHCRALQASPPRRGSHCSTLSLLAGAALLLLFDTFLEHPFPRWWCRRQITKVSEQQLQRQQQAARRAAQLVVRALSAAVVVAGGRCSSMAAAARPLRCLPLLRCRIYPNHYQRSLLGFRGAQGGRGGAADDDDDDDREEEEEGWGGGADDDEEELEARSSHHLPLLHARAAAQPTSPCRSPPRRRVGRHPAIIPATRPSALSPTPRPPSLWPSSCLLRPDGLPSAAGAAAAG